MRIELVLNEISSAALKEVTQELWQIIERVQSKEIQPTQGGIEIAGCKHMIQSIAIDWAFNGKKEKLQKLMK
jgi:hypothetical protein